MRACLLLRAVHSNIKSVLKVSGVILPVWPTHLIFLVLSQPHRFDGFTLPYILYANGAGKRSIPALPSLGTIRLVSKMTVIQKPRQQPTKSSIHYYSAPFSLSNRPLTGS